MLLLSILVLQENKTKLQTMVLSCLFAKFMELLLMKPGMSVVYSHSVFFCEVNYTEQFNVESHKSLR